MAGKLAPAKRQACSPIGPAALELTTAPAAPGGLWGRERGGGQEGRESSDTLPLYLEPPGVPCVYL